MAKTTADPWTRTIVCAIDPLETIRHERTAASCGLRCLCFLSAWPPGRVPVSRIERIGGRLGLPRPYWGCSPPWPPT